MGKAESTKQNRKKMGTNHSSPAQSNKPRRESRRIYWALMAVSLLAIVFSGAMLAKRIGAYNSTRDFPLYAYIGIQSTSFDFAGRKITLKEDTVDGQDVVRVTYGDKELILDVAIKPQQPFPSFFERQKDWMTMNFFADRSGMSIKDFMGRIKRDEIKPRLSIVTRTPFGIDPIKPPKHEQIQQEENASSGDVHRDRWRFDCYEFLRDGTITHEVKRYPESGLSLQYRQNFAKLKGEPIPQRREGELAEHTWQRGAALKIMPRPPAITMEEQPLKNAGWTLPLTAAGFLVFLVSFFFAIAPDRTREQSITD